MSGRNMKRIILILFLFTCFLVKAQQDEEIKIDTIYNNLINYKPKGYTIDETSKPKNKFF